MFLVQMWKEIKVFFTSRGNLLFMFVMPLLLITIFSFALRDYISADYGTFDDGRVYSRGNYVHVEYAVRPAVWIDLNR